MRRRPAATAVRYGAYAVVSGQKFRVFFCYDYVCYQCETESGARGGTSYSGNYRCILESQPGRMKSRIQVLIKLSFYRIGATVFIWTFHAEILNTKVTLCKFIDN
jgi:hypothetical protein